MARAFDRLVMAWRDGTAVGHIPYTAHVSPYVVATKFGDFVQAFRISGTAFETTDDAEINARHEQLNMLWRSIGSTHVSVWTHLIRQREESYPDGSFPTAFAADLDRLYRQRIAGERLMRNDWYLALVYRPTPHAASNVMARLLTRAPTAIPCTSWSKLALTSPLS